MDAQCTVCGQKVAVIDRYCDGCGADQTTHRPICGRCGHQGRCNARYCSVCGCALSPVVSETPCPLCGTVGVGFNIDCPGCGSRSSTSAETARPNIVPRTYINDAIEPRVVEATPQLPTETLAEEQRKLATVLFADVSGFTAMSERLDPEQVRDIMDRCFEVLTAEIVAQGGTIDKYIGDCVMAYFGIPVAYEDDPQRATRAGLRMLEALALFSDELQASTGLRLGMRIGINTGKVLAGRVGGHGHKEFTVYGDAVNIASRLEHAAPVGGVLISEDTYRAVRAWFDVQPQQPLYVKGKTEPLHTFRVLSEIAEPGALGMRGIEGLRTDLVGRDAELSALLAWAAETRTSARARIITIMGPAGVGKSRLVEELLSRLPSGTRTLRARCLPPGFGKPLHAIRELVLALCGRAADLPGEKASEKPGVEQLVTLGVSADGAAALVRLWTFATPITQDERELWIRRTYRGLQELLFATLSNQKSSLSSVLILEDIHWADAVLLDLIDFVAVGATVPLLIVCISRPELLDVRPAFSEGKDHHRRLDLQPLSDAATATLVRALLSKVDVLPTSIVNQIVARAAGNPFFVEELVRVLLDSGVIRCDEDRWTLVSGAVKQLDLPGSIQAVLQARLDSLPTQERDAVVAAAVVGRVFWQDIVDQLLGRSTAPALSRLRGRGLLFGRDGTGVAGQHEFVFASAMLQLVAYDRVLVRTKREQHKHVARWLQTFVDWQTADVPLWAAYAGHLTYAEQFADASVAWSQAANGALEQGDDVQASAYLTQAIDVAQKHTPPLDEHVGLFLRFGEVCDRLARYADGRAAFEQAVSLLLNAPHRQVPRTASKRSMVTSPGHRAGSKLDDNVFKLILDSVWFTSPLLAQARLGLGNICVRTGDLTAAATWVALAQRSALVDQWPECWELAARVAFYRGQYDVAFTHCQRVLDGSATTRQRIAALRTLSMVGLRRGTLDAAEVAIDQGTALCRQLGDELLGCRMGLMRANLDNLRGNSESAISGYLSACSIAEKLSDFHTARMCHNNLGELFVELGRWADAQKPLEKSAFLCNLLGVKNQVSDTLRLLGEVTLRLGDHATAAEHGKRAYGMAQQTGERNFEAESARFLAQIALQEPGAAALGSSDVWFTTAESILRDIQSDVLLAKSWLRFAETLIDTGQTFNEPVRREKGLAMAEQAARSFARLGMTADEQKAWALFGGTVA